MASNYYQPDPYQGWSVIGGFGNTTAHQLMTDTSGQWVFAYQIGGIRVYERWTLA